MEEYCLGNRLSEHPSRPMSAGYSGTGRGVQSASPAVVHSPVSTAGTAEWQYPWMVISSTDRLLQSSPGCLGNGFGVMRVYVHPGRNDNS